MRFLKNFRRGFATNSSSSHSFVYMKTPDHSVGVAPLGEDFGWNDFRLSTLKEKLFYVLVDRLDYDWSPEEAMENLGDEFPEFTRDDFDAAKGSYIDHQSRGTITMEQARDPYVTVFGGNDNSDGSEERASAFQEIDWTRTEPTWEEEERIATLPTATFMEETEFYGQPNF